MSTAAGGDPTGAPPTSAALPPAHPALGAPQQLHLRDIHEPAAPPAWPPAPGWWLLAALLLAALLPGFWRLRRVWRRRRRRERIIAELEGLHGGDCSPALIAGVSALLKRAALSRFPHAEVAALTGEDWLAFLDRTGGGGGFTAGAGRVLAEGVYAPRQDCDAPALLALARRWLRQNL
ncbi:DUF4381 domain-containing protein [uncultured Thiohalocapsa sp.]|uniref:DUF4381 domain-containing protein n=1 Tax=uncultured Thiohalocapsa sp. TaxID=768990 RepID=UPI0025EABF84|nr:DUF4381 domain-containing protein [uncultured Thiohalocapsa sp.]